jgi:drug/metabolite transporter (DMT)-like permease
LSQWIAVTAALVGALVFGISAVAEQRGTKHVEKQKTLSPKIFLGLVKQPVWLLGVGGLIAGFILQVVALRFGSLALVEPILVGDLVFAVLISAYLRGSRDPAIFGGVAACTIGVVGFLAVARPSGGNPDDGLDTFIPLAIGYGVVLTSCLTVARRSARLRPLALALATGVSYGTTAFLIKLVTAEADTMPHLFTTWPLYAVAIVAPLGFLLNQNAYQQGTIVAPVLAIITSSDPLWAILLAGLLLDEKLASTPMAIVGEMAALILMTTGVIVIARHSPQAATAGPGPQTAAPLAVRLTPERNPNRDPRSRRECRRPAGTCHR